MSKYFDTAQHFFRISVVCLFALCIFACGGKEEPKTVEQGSVAKVADTPEEVVWSFQRGAVSINLQAAADLNFEDGQAHTLAMCVYQLDKQDGFTMLAANAEGLAKLLQCKPFDESAKTAARSIASPASNTCLVYDRAEGAKHIGIVAGYASMNPKTSTLLLSIPIATETTGLIWSNDVFFPGLFTAAVQLGPDGLQELTHEEGSNSAKND